MHDFSDLSDVNWFESYPRDETVMNSDLVIMLHYCIEWFLFLSEGEHSAVEFISLLGYAWLSDLSDANWFESYPRDETAMNSDLFIMYIIALSDFSPIRGTT